MNYSHSKFPLLGKIRSVSIQYLNKHYTYHQLQPCLGVSLPEPQLLNVPHSTSHLSLKYAQCLLDDAVLLADLLVYPLECIVLVILLDHDILQCIKTMLVVEVVLLQHREQLLLMSHTL